MHVELNTLFWFPSFFCLTNTPYIRLNIRGKKEGRYDAKRIDL